MNITVLVQITWSYIDRIKRIPLYWIRQGSPGEHNDGGDSEVESQGVILQPRPQVHSEDGSEASSEGESEHAHLDVQAHTDDSVPGLVQLRVDELLCLVDLGQHCLVRECNFLKQILILVQM